MNEPLRAVDTSVLLRYLLNDIPDQSAIARDLIDSGEPLALTAVTLAELAWTLTGPRLRRPRPRVVDALVDVVMRENMVALGFDKAEMATALLRCRPDEGGAGFGDAIIAACALSGGVSEVSSFDREIGRSGLTPVSLPRA